MRWMERAACADFDADLWTASDNSDRRIVSALRVCNACPVLAECRAHALDSWDLGMDGTGIWGGLLPHERRAIRRQRRQVAA